MLPVSPGIIELVHFTHNWRRPSGSLSGGQRVGVEAKVQVGGGDGAVESCTARLTRAIACFAALRPGFLRKLRAGCAPRLCQVSSRRQPVVPNARHVDRCPITRLPASGGVRAAALLGHSDKNAIPIGGRGVGRQILQAFLIEIVEGFEADVAAAAPVERLARPRPIPRPSTGPASPARRSSSSWNAAVPA